VKNSLLVEGGLKDVRVNEINKKCCLLKTKGVINK